MNNLGTAPARGPLISRPLIALLLALCLAVPACSPRENATSWLEEQTGQTEFVSQMKALVRLALLRQPVTQDLTPVSHTGVYPFGASTFFEQEVEEEKLRRSMELLREAGVLWIRQEFPWDRIEWTGKGQFVGPFGDTWEHYDRIVRLAEEYGLQIVARPDFPPFWSRQDNSVVRAPPDDYNDYGDFVAALAARYKGRIKHYQIWNEPNTVLEWGRAPVAAEYVELLKVAYQRAKSVDPEVVIIAAALAPTLGTPDGLNVDDLDYLTAMYQAGAQDYFDVMAAQGYGLWTGPGDRRAEASQANLSRVQLTREVMVRNGDAHKAIWISEFGWDAVPLDFHEPAHHGRVTEQQQARYTKAGLERIQQEWPWVGVVFYWHFRKVDDAARQHEDFYFRLVDPDFTLRPVYDALKEVTSSPPALHYGWRQEDHWGIQYSEGWQEQQWQGLPPAHPAGYRLAREAGNAISFWFKGTAVTLVTARGPAGGTFAVTIDGLPGAAGVQTLLASEAEREVLLSLASGLPDDYHRVVLTTLDGGDVVVDGFIVTAQRGFLPQQGAAAALLLGSALAIGLGVATASRWRW